MKNRIYLSVFLLMTAILPVIGQVKGKKQIREEESQRKMAETENILNTKIFTFVAQWAYPVGGGQIDLRTNPNHVSFDPEQLEGFMPFFGTGYVGLGFGGESGIRFNDKPIEYNTSRTKKYFLIEAKVKGVNDVFRLALTVTAEGRADLSVISNNRSTIRYSGEIMAPEKAGK
jgi:hypothetical protein